MKIVALVVVCLSLLCTPSRAQSPQGGMRGSVSDAGGIIRAAAVDLVDEGTGLARRTATNDTGEFVFANLAAGTYRVSVVVPGYKTSERTGVRIGTQSFLTIDIVLAPGGVAEHVTVDGRAAVERSNGSVSALLDRTDLETLPSAGRNVFVMTAITPGVILSGDSRFVRQQDQSNSSLISIAGGPRRDNSYTLDGVPIVDIVNRATFIPSLQAVEEIRVQTSAYDAEVGRTSGGVFNTVARSGSNAWHGSGLYQTRPNWAQSQSFFAAKGNLPDADTYFHLYGGSFGGPIVKNRTFFWASSEGYRSLTTRSGVMVLPTEAERRGDFSQAGVTIYDPLTTRLNPANPSQFIRDPFPNNQIPSGRLNPVALALLQYLPLPTSGNSRPATASLVDAADQLTGKITHRWTDRLTTTGLYAWYGSTEPDPRYFGGAVFTNAADPGEGALVRRVHTIALTTNWARNNALVEVRYGFNQFLDDNRPASFDPSQLGFAQSFLRTAPQLTFPSIGVVGYGAPNGFLGDRFQSTATYGSHDVNVSVSKLVGRHALKVGADARTTGVQFENSGGMGGYTFNTNMTFGPDPNAPASNTGDGFAGFLLGYPSSGGISVSSPIDAYLNYWSGFAQDDLRLTPKLTMTLGLRYEFEQGLQERNNRIAVGWAFDQPFPVQVGGVRPDGTPLALTGGLVYAGVNGAPTHQGDPGAAQFAPRLGAAYSLDDRTVVRGGYGLFWAAPQGISADEFGTATPGYNQSTNYLATGTNPFVPCATCSLTNPFPSGFAQPSGNSLGRMTDVGSYVEFVDPHSEAAHFHRYSIDVQRELSQRVVVSAGYVGMIGRNLAGGIGGGALNINQLDPKFMALGTRLQEPVANPFLGTPLAVGILADATVTRGQLLRPYPQFDAVYDMRSSLSRSRYDALVASAERRLHGGWGASANYTWSRFQDSQYGESNFFAGGSAILNNQNVDAEYGLSVQDTPHRLNATVTLDRWGWTLSAAATYQSGFPVTVQQAANNSNLLGSTQRPNIVPGVNPQLTTDLSSSYDASCGCIRWLNPAAWSPAAPFTFGNAPRTDGRVRTPPRRNVDLALQRLLPLTGRTVSVRAELINVFNFVDYLGPDIAFGNATFGQIRSAAGFPRMLQLSLQAKW